MLPSPQTIYRNSKKSQAIAGYDILNTHGYPGEPVSVVATGRRKGNSVRATIRRDMTSDLSDLLLELDRAWERLGVPDLSTGLAPGLTSDEVIQALSDAGLPAPVEIVEWFTWHNGRLDSAQGLLARPAGGHLLSLSQAIDLAPVLRTSTEVDMHRWLPLDSQHLLVADLGVHPVKVELHYVMWGDDPQESAIVRSPSLATTVSTWLDILAHWPLDPDGFLDWGQRVPPQELQDRGMLG